MADAIVRLRVESSEYDQKLSRATQQLQHMEKEVRRTGATFAYADKEEIAFIQSLGSMETKTTSAKSQLREYTEALMQMTSTYRNLTQEEKNSDWGKALAASMDEIKGKAAMLKDAMADVNREIGGMASDTQVFDQIAGGVTGLVSVFQVGQGAMQMFGVKSNEAMQAMAKLQGAMAVANGLTKIQAALQKESNLMQGVAKVQRLAAAAAQEMETKAMTGNVAATKAATVAQKALNAVAKANPFLLLASAIGAVVGALAIFSGSASKAAQDQKKLAESVGSSMGKMVTSYNILKDEWHSLTTEQEKDDWIKNNADKFNELGVSIESVSDAEKVFVQNTEAMIQSFQLRAKASALQTLAEENYKEYYENYEKKKDKLVKAGDTLSYTDNQNFGVAARLNGYAEASGFLGLESKWTEEGAKWYNEQLLGTGEQDANAFLEELQKINAELDELYKKNDFKKAESGVAADVSAIANTDTGKSTEQTPAGSIKAMREQVQELQKAWELATTDDQRAVLKKQIDDVSAALDNMMGKAKEAAEVVTEPQELNPTMNGPQMGAFEQLQQSIRIKLADNASSIDTTSLNNLLSVAIQNGIDSLNPNFEELMYKMGEGFDIPDEAWEELAAQINEKLANLGLDPIELDVQTGAVTTAAKDATDNAKSTADAWQNAVAAVNNVGSALQQIEDPAAKVSGIVMQAVANIALGFAQAAASPATGAAGVFGWIAAATAGVATMASTIAAIKSATSGSYASGGIIPGNSFSGDNLTANVNSGELILNRAQQGAIAGQLEGNSMGNMQLETRISGTDMLIFLNNTNRSLGGSRSFYSERH